VVIFWNCGSFRRLVGPAAHRRTSVCTEQYKHRRNSDTTRLFVTHELSKAAMSLNFTVRPRYILILSSHVSLVVSSFGIFAIENFVCVSCSVIRAAYLARLRLCSFLQASLRHSACHVVYSSVRCLWRFQCLSFPESETTERESSYCAVCQKVVTCDFLALVGHALSVTSPFLQFQKACL